jgi:hypothetical protein
MNRFLQLYLSMYGRCNSDTGRFLQYDITYIVLDTENCVIYPILLILYSEYNDNPFFLNLS